MTIPTILDFYVYGFPILSLYLLGIAFKMRYILLHREQINFIMENYYT